jgi:hypothetical protein
MQIANSHEKRKIDIRTSSTANIAWRLWPVAQPNQGSLAGSLLNNVNEQKGSTDVRCDHWINHPRAEHYWIREDSLRLNEGTVLSLLWWEDERQLMDLDDSEEYLGTKGSDGRTDWD